MYKLKLVKLLNMAPTLVTFVSCVASVCGCFCVCFQVGWHGMACKVVVGGGAVIVSAVRCDAVWYVTAHLVSVYGGRGGVGVSRHQR